MSWRHLATFVLGPGSRSQANVTWSNGLPCAQCDSCEFYDGKRCSLQGMRPQAICEPVVQRMAEMMDGALATAVNEAKSANNPESPDGSEG